MFYYWFEITDGSDGGRKRKCLEREREICK